MNNENRYYTVPEYAKQFNIAESYVREPIRCQGLPMLDIIIFAL